MRLSCGRRFASSLSFLHLLLGCSVLTQCFPGRVRHTAEATLRTKETGRGNFVTNLIVILCLPSVFCFLFCCPSLALRRRCWKPATRLLAKNATSLPSRMACCVTGTRTGALHPPPLPRLPQPTFSTWRFLAFKSTTRVLRSFRLYQGSSKALIRLEKFLSQ